MKKTLNKTARFLHESYREYRGQARVRTNKKLANRIERRTSKVRHTDES